MKQKIDYKHGHPNWLQEISEAFEEDDKVIVKKLKYISEDLGPLGTLAYIRLKKFFDIILKGSKIDEHYLLV